MTSVLEKPKFDLSDGGPESNAAAPGFILGFVGGAVYELTRPNPGPGIDRHIGELENEVNALQNIQTDAHTSSQSDQALSRFAESKILADKKEIKALTASRPNTEIPIFEMFGVGVAGAVALVSLVYAIRYGAYRKTLKKASSETIKEAESFLRDT